MIGIKAVKTYRPVKRTTLEELKITVPLSDEEYVRLRDNHGMRQVMDSEQDSTYNMVKKALLEIIDSESIVPEQIDCIIFGHAMQSHPSGVAFLEKLKLEVGLMNIPSFTVSDMNCASVIMTFKIAYERLLKSRKSKAILLFAEKTYTPSMRKIGHMTVLADGAAACLIERDMNENAILNISQFVDGSIAKAEGGDEEAFRWFQVSYFLGIKKVLYRSLKDIGAKKEEIRMICPHNVNKDTWDYVSRSLDIPHSRIYTANIEQLGHVNGCDLLINLEDILRLELLQPGDLYYLTSVGLGGAYGCIALRR